ncbi:MAG TPA: hypothetical protein PLY52_03300 [Methanothrix sp.]|jgi:hypothetical protein|uniref:hypothetical protein n=1 Tax=Methanothrix sp. TaxID=90426 RepID=UPI0016B1DCFB|nr:hypothetical protein [Methanothrix sp.]MDI9416446.1 hypothetical protein [Euryarchaeota archaeon]NLH37892.1 hypothetical protein [Thermotogaceae bacterium]HON35321.1 hypothetical protein [Methanothrix sp.]HRU75784.1 hypothetical protein [Methanothrix sp.]
MQKLEPNFTGINNLNENLRAAAEAYTLRRPNDVYDFLKKEPSAIALVSEAHERIREHFPQDEIFLEVLRDPDSPMEKELLISISTRLPPIDAIKKLDAFDDSWWLGASSNSPVDICIKVEYR